jgi:hypothetical protein
VKKEVKAMTEEIRNKIIILSLTLLIALSLFIGCDVRIGDDLFRYCAGGFVENEFDNKVCSDKTSYRNLMGVDDD